MLKKANVRALHALPDFNTVLIHSDEGLEAYALDLVAGVALLAARPQDLDASRAGISTRGSDIAGFRDKGCGALTGRSRLVIAASPRPRILPRSLARILERVEEAAQGAVCVKPCQGDSRCLAGNVCHDRTRSETRATTALPCSFTPIHPHRCCLRGSDRAAPEACLTTAEQVRR